MAVVFLLICAVFVAVNGNQYRFDYSYSESAGGWFKVHKIPATWDEARIRCGLEGAVLASPVNKNVTAAMVVYMRRAGVDPECGVFTGTNARYSKGDYYSIEGEPLSRMPVRWMQSEPDNYNDGESCIVLNASGSIADASCSLVLPYICYKKAGRFVPLNECGTSDQEYKLFPKTGNCYKLHVKPRNWSSAFMACSAEGGYLAIPNDKDQAMHLRDLYKQNRAVLNTNMLLGFKDIDRNGIFTTIHGSRLEDNYAAWKPGQPEGQGLTPCGAMYPDGLLDDYDCKKLAPFVCEKTVDSLLQSDKNLQ